MPERVELTRQGLAATLTVEVGPDLNGVSVVRDGQVLEDGFHTHDEAEAWLDGYVSGWRDSDD